VSTVNIAKSDIPLWSGSDGALVLDVSGDLTKGLLPGANPIVNASFTVDGNHDIALVSQGTVGIGVHAGATVRIVPIFLENQGAGADLVTRFSLADTLTTSNVLLALEVGGTGQISAQGAFNQNVLAVNATLEAGTDATYVVVRSFARTPTTLGEMLFGLARGLALPGGITMPPAAGDLVSFEYGGVLKYSVGASAGYELKGTSSIRISEIALSEHYSLSVIGKLTLTGQVAGRFSVDVTRGSQDGFARVVVKRRRLKELQIAADVTASASLTTSGLPASGKEFLGALLGLQARNWLHLADSLVTPAGQVDTVDTLKTKLDGLARDFLSALAGKAIDQLTSPPDLQAFQTKLAAVVDSYRELDERAIALFDRYFDPVFNRVQDLTARLNILNQMDNWDSLSGEVDPMLWNVLRQLTDGDPLGWALGFIPGTNVPSIPELKRRVNNTLSLIRDTSHQQIRDFILLAKEQFGLDPFFHVLATLKTPEDLKAVANAKLGHFVERLVGSAIGQLNGNALKKALDAVKAVVAARDQFFNSFDTILKEAAAQKFTQALHGAYNSSSERDALIDMEIRLRQPDGSPNATGLRYMEAAGRGDFQEVLASYQPDVVRLREGVLSHRVSSQTSLSFNVAGWHQQFNYQAMHRVIVDAEQQIRDTGNGLLTVFTTADMTADSERRKHGCKSEQAVMTSFLLRVLGETRVSDSSFDKETAQYAIDVVTGMSARYSVTFTDEDTSSDELDDYLLFAKTLGLDAVGANRAVLAPFLELKDGSFGKTSSAYDVRYTERAIAMLMAARPLSSDIRQILRRIVLANYFSDPQLHDVGWLYGSDDVRTLFDDNPNAFVEAQSVLDGAVVRLTSSVPGLKPPPTFVNSRQVRADVAVLLRIENATIEAFGQLSALLQTTTPIKTADLEVRLNAFGKALDAFDGFDHGDNSVFAVFDGLVQLQTAGDAARASSLTFTSVKNGADHTKVFARPETSSHVTGLVGANSPVSRGSDDAVVRATVAGGGAAATTLPDLAQPIVRAQTVLAALEPVVNPNASDAIAALAAAIRAAGAAHTAAAINSVIAQLTALRTAAEAAAVRTTADVAASRATRSEAEAAQQAAAAVQDLAAGLTRAISSAALAPMANVMAAAPTA
jgi:hypothetical protein